MPAQGSNAFFQFNYIPYPLWRRKMPFGVKPMLDPILRRYYPVDADRRTVPTVNDVADYLMRFGLIRGALETDLRNTLRDNPPPIELVDEDKRPALTDQPARLPAQWEPMERIIISWAVNFPPLWEMHAQMVEAITPVADVQINVNHPLWAGAVRMYLESRGKANMRRVRFYHLPTDDIWVRDYGPLVALDNKGERVVVAMIYDPLPNYPQERDNLMPERWAAHEGFSLMRMDFHGEGGNVWTDGDGTLLMTNQAYRLNPDLNRDELLRRLHAAFDFEKLILLPRLRVEETGHIDLLTKLGNANTVFISAPTATFSADRLRAARAQLRRETNARGQHYRLVELPTPPLYWNWFGFPVRRSYTNALTVNGRILVPIYGIPDDDKAIRVYSDAMPDMTIVPIDSHMGANGGGAVHCMTKEVPQATAQS